MHLITSHQGVEHITSANMGVENANFFGRGNYIFNHGNCFNFDLPNENTIRIYDGEGMMNGRHFELIAGSYEDLIIGNGAQLMYRNDLVVARYELNQGTGVETVELILIEGVPSATAPVDPEYHAGNILDGDTIVDFPLYRISLYGIDQLNVIPLFTPIGTMGERVESAERKYTDIKIYTESAKDSASKAKVSETNASQSEEGAQAYSVTAEAAEEQTKIYYDEVRRIAGGLVGGFIPMGSIAFEDLPTNVNNGWMYNITNDFVTDDRFVEGEGVSYKAGTNVYWLTSESKWDVFTSGFSKESLGLENVDNTSDLDKPISTATQAALDGKLDNEAIDVVSDEWNATTQYEAGTFAIDDNTLYKSLIKNSGTKPSTDDGTNWKATNVSAEITQLNVDLSVKIKMFSTNTSLSVVKGGQNITLTKPSDTNYNYYLLSVMPSDGLIYIRSTRADSALCRINNEGTAGTYTFQSFFIGIRK